MKLSVNTIHVIQMNIYGLVAILIGILGLFTICSCSTTKVIINQNELPDECYSGVKKDSTVKTEWVLILVLMEYALRGSKRPLILKIIYSLNPCFNGICSAR